MGSLQDVQRNWEILAQADPMWGALMDPEKVDGGWEPAAFFAVGEEEIATVFDQLSKLGVEPDLDGRALDFGCGIGRLTQALASRFNSACGVDISPTMIKLARDANRYPHKCEYIVNDAHELSLFEDSQFAFIYTSVVLQHMEPRFSTQYLREFARVLAPGGVLVFQVPDRVEPGRSPRQKAAQLAYNLRRAVGLRTRGRRALRRLGLARGPASRGEAVVEMHCLPEAEVRRILDQSALEIVDIQLTNSTDLAFVIGERPDRQSLFAVGGLQYLDTEPTVGFVSKQYCATKLS
jgi:ubiquinone/menaquinone biosynthesis C-methylase UbiE